MLVTTMSLAKTAEQVEMWFGIWTRKGSMYCVLHGGLDNRSRGHFGVWLSAVDIINVICKGAAHWCVFANFAYYIDVETCLFR